MARSKMPPQPGLRKVKSKRLAKQKSSSDKSKRSGLKNKSTRTTSGRTKRRQLLHQGRDTSFPFLYLPAELRNTIYEKVCEGQPQAYLISRAKGHLACRSALPRVSRQVRDEFLPVLYLCACELIASVKDFDFRHIVTFINRLSDTEMKAILPTIDTPSLRLMTVELTFEHKLEYGNFLSPEYSLLNRWVNRMAYSTKKGTNIAVSYTVIKKSSKQSADLRAIIDGTVGQGLQDASARELEEKKKIVDAIDFASRS